MIPSGKLTRALARRARHRDRPHAADTYLEADTPGSPHNTSDLLHFAIDAAAAARDMSDMGRRPQDAPAQQQDMNL